MDIQNLRLNFPRLITHMKNMGYSKNYIQQVRREIKILLENPEKWNVYDDFIKSYKTYYANNHNAFVRKKAVIMLIARFDLNGMLPRDLSNLNSHSFHKGSYLQLDSEFQGLIDFYDKHANRDKRKESTIHNECCNTGSFLLKLQKKGIDSLAAINQDNILDILVGSDGYPIKSASYANQIIAVFRGSLEYSCECERIAIMLPMIRRHRKNIQYLKPNERANIKKSLQDESNTMSYRDKAIGCLLYYTGLRCCDISNLKFEDIDWDKEEISIRQQKTEVPIKLPLTSTVGNAIYDYITLERRKSECKYIFLSFSYPFEKMKSKTIASRSYPLFKEAKIRQSPGDQRGAHIFRHNLATTMLENGVSRAVISRVLGHTNPSSTDVYLSADMVHLKEFALSIEAFPVREGALKNERV